LAVLYAYAGDSDKADEKLGLAITNRGPDPTNLFVHVATRGLLEFRKGNISNGVANYMKAIEIAVEQKQPINCLRLFTFLCKEISLLDWEMSQQILSIAKKFEAEFQKKGRKVPIDISYTINALSENNKTLFQSEELHNALNMSDGKIDLLKSLFEDVDEA
jgi:hypothetical protein